MTIFQKALEQITNGANWHIDLKLRTLHVNGKALVKNGECNGELTDWSNEDYSSKEKVLNTLNDGYKLYKKSIPSERSNSRRRVYFKALHEHELSDNDMLYGMPRDEAQFLLEFRLLNYAINGVFDKHWDEWKLGNWFWQSDEDKDFVILKDWVVKH